MSAPLKELRFGVPEAVHILLNARATAFDEDIGALARKILSDWAKREAHAHRVAAKLFRNTGMQPELFGGDEESGGFSQEESGSARKGAK